jgi:hypothetical protein
MRLFGEKKCNRKVMEKILCGKLTRLGYTLFVGKKIPEAGVTLRNLNSGVPPDLFATGHALLAT